MKNYAALVLLFLIIIAAVPIAVTKIRAAAKIDDSISLPETVSVYLENEKRIVMIDYPEYITGCVFGTVSPMCEKETLEAVACACNTFALYQLENVSKSVFNGADFSDNPKISQAYMTSTDIMDEYGESYERFYKKVSESVSEGIKRVITYDGNVIFPAMCSISTGKTDDGYDILGAGFPYLRPVSAECDKDSGDYTSTVSLSANSVKNTLKFAAPSAVLPADISAWFKDAEYLPTGTLDTVKYGGIPLSGETLKEALGLRSAAVTIEFSADNYVFTCKGYGSNIGMSLYCANNMALNGDKMEDIIKYFYDGVELKSVS